jgi:secreted trypsin-like serine protease
MRVVVAAALIPLQVAAARAQPAAAPTEMPPAIAAALARSFPASVVRERMRRPPAAPGVNEERSKVVGGKDAAPGQFKWQVALIRSDAPADNPYEGFYCGASLIGWRWVLTAAHCTFESDPRGNHLPPIPLKPADIDAYLGSHDFSGGQRVRVRRIVRHERYERISQDSDLALLELGVELQDRDRLELLRPLPADDEAPLQPGKLATVMGWGSTGRGIIPSEKRKSVQVLQYVDDLRFKPTAPCNRYHLDDRRMRAGGELRRQGRDDTTIRSYLDVWFPPRAETITDNMLCAGTNDGSKDACFGDSGGPLVVYRNRTLLQAGVVSWGPASGCGLTNLFGVYVRLSHYLDWIAANTR